MKLCCTFSFPRCFLKVVSDLNQRGRQVPASQVPCSNMHVELSEFRGKKSRPTTSLAVKIEPFIIWHLNVFSARYGLDTGVCDAVGQIDHRNYKVHMKQKMESCFLPRQIIAET